MKAAAVQIAEKKKERTAVFSGYDASAPLEFGEHVLYLVVLRQWIDRWKSLWVKSLDHRPGPAFVILHLPCNSLGRILVLQRH